MIFRYSCDIIDKTETFTKKEKDEKTAGEQASAQ